jgi:hypothetical protein
MTTVRLCGFGLLLATLVGCGSLEPWVKPYERAHLADPVMSRGRDAISAAYSEHAIEVRQSARGASGVSGGGCGCN